MSFDAILREQRRLVMLRLLSEQTAYKANSAVLHSGLVFLGIASSRDDVRTDLHWLRDQNLLTITEVAPGVEVAALTGRGLDVVQGHAVVPGVARPTPR